MTDHLIKFNSDAYRGAHIEFDGSKGESLLCLHFLGDGTADAVLKSLAKIIYSETPAAPAIAAAPESFDEQPPPAWEDTYGKETKQDVDSVVRSLQEDDTTTPLPEDGSLVMVSGADVPNMKEMLELMQGKFGPGGSPG